MFNTELSTTCRCSRPSLKVALLGSHLAHWAGGNDFLRLCAGGLWQKQLSSQATFSLFLADATPIEVVRRHLGPWKQLAGRLLKFEKPRLIRRPPVRIEQVIDAVRSFGGKLHSTGYRDRRGTYGGLIRILEQQSYDAVLPFALSPGRFPLPWVGY